MKRPQRPDPRTLVGQSPPQRPNEHLPDAFPDRERDRYASRALAYVILLNGAAALILVTALAFAPQSASDPRRLTWAMLVLRCISGLAEFLTCIHRSNCNRVKLSHRAGRIAPRSSLSHSFFRLPLLPRLRRALIVVCPAELLSLSSLCVT